MNGKLPKLLFALIIPICDIEHVISLHCELWYLVYAYGISHKESTSMPARICPYL